MPIKVLLPSECITPDNYRDHQVCDGKLQLVTASSIKLFMRCPLQWYRETVLGLKRPDTSEMALGRAVHKAIEIAVKGQFKKIEPIAYGYSTVWESAQKALDFVGCSGEPEVPMRGEMTIAGVPVWGKIDLIQGDNLYDWKTIGASSRPSKPILKQDPQKILYSRWWMGKNEQRSTRFHFVYLSKILPDFVVVSFDCIHSDFEPFKDIVESMKHWAASATEPICTCRKCLHESQKMAKKVCEPLVIPMEPAVSIPKDFHQDYLELWVDCLPIKGRSDLTFLDSLIAERALKICAAHPTREGVPVDIRCIEFGKGKGYLADDFRKNPPSGRVIARSGELADAVIEVLIPIAQHVHLKTR